MTNDDVIALVNLLAKRLAALLMCFLRQVEELRQPEQVAQDSEMEFVVETYFEGPQAMMLIVVVVLFEEIQVEVKLQEELLQV